MKNRVYYVHLKKDEAQYMLLVSAKRDMQGQPTDASVLSVCADRVSMVADLTDTAGAVSVFAYFSTFVRYFGYRFYAYYIAKYTPHAMLFCPISV